MGNWLRVQGRTGYIGFDPCEGTASYCRHLGRHQHLRYIWYDPYEGTASDSGPDRQCRVLRYIGFDPCVRVLQARENCQLAS